MSRDLSNFIVMAIGHEPEHLKSELVDPEVVQSVKNCITESLNKYKQIYPDIWVITHMRRGSGQYVAEVCINENIPFTGVLSYNGFESGWNEDDQILYDELLHQADEVHVTSPGDNAGYKSAVRDKWMMINSHCALIVYNPQRKSGETHNAVVELQRIRKPVIAIKPGIQSKVKEIKMENF